MQMQGGLIRTAELAVQIAEALCAAHYGKDELEQQKPLLAIDKENRWRVEGSFNRDGKIVGGGNFFLSIEKYDGRVTDIGRWFRNPEGEEFVRKMMAAETPEEKNELLRKHLAATRGVEEEEK